MFRDLVKEEGTAKKTGKEQPVSSKTIWERTQKQRDNILKIILSLLRSEERYKSKRMNKIQFLSQKIHSLMRKINTIDKGIKS